MFNLFRKIPKGYVETVDGYLVKESEAKSIKKVVSNKTTNVWYRKENAPKYDTRVVNIGWLDRLYRQIEVKEDGTPIGYHTIEEFDLLSNRIAELQARIKELEDKYENDDFIMCCDTDSTIKKISFGDAIEQLSNTKNIKSGYIGKIEGVELYTSKPKNKRGRPKKK
jgi:hypothetical protein